MFTLKQLAKLHKVNRTSLRIWLNVETKIRPATQELIHGRATNMYDRDAATAVAEFLKHRPKNTVGRPPKAGRKS